MSATGKFFRPGKKFLRPAMDDEDDDDDDSSEEEEEEEVAKETSGATKTADANLSSDDDDDDDDEDDDGEGDEDEDDDEEEEDDDDDDRKRKKSGPSGGNKRQKVSSFFDEEAEDDEEEEEDDEPYGTHHDPHDRVKKHYTEEDKLRENLDAEAMEVIRQQDRRRAQLARFGSVGEDEREQQRSAMELAREIEDRHRMQSRRVDRSMLDRRIDEEGGVGGPESFTAVSQQSLLPSVSDPSLWMISCSTGKEQELIFQIMNKCAAYARQRRPLGICGAVAGQTKGKIYIESYSEPAVVEAIQGIRGLLQYTMRLVPIQDMPTVMTVTPKKKPVKANEWVRMSRGHYKGDLALVRSVRDSGLKCVVQCVPRLDLTLSDLPPDEARVRRRTVKPPQKFFNAQEVAALGKHPLRQRFPALGIFCDFFEGNYFEDGYLLKEMTVGSMVKPCTDEDPPTLDELQRFRKRPGKEAGGKDADDENEGSKMAGSLLDELSELQGQTGLGRNKSSGGGLLIGDTVEVIEGDLVGMRGKLMTMDGSTVKIKPLDASLDIGGTGEVEFLANQVRKFIAVGAHVKVIDGRYSNETGVVVAVDQMEGETDFTAVVLTDVTNKEITVRTSQLRESAEVASGLDKLAGYELYDLVVLSGGGSANEVGVIVRVGREDFTVVNNHGISRDVRPEELRGKRNQMSNRAVALDVQGNQIRCGDSVNVAEGPHRGKTATIKRMSRSQLFLYSQTRSEHAGIFVVRSRSCVLAGTRTQNRSATAGDGGATPFATPQSQNRGGPGGGRGKRDDVLMGKTVRILSGQWKRYLGTVCDATATHVQVELHSRLKKVMVLRDRVAVAGDKFGATENIDSQNIPLTGPGAPTTPFIGGATPMHGGATPMHGGATPMHDSSNSDDAVWRPGALDQEADTADGSGDGWGAVDNNGTAQPPSFGVTEKTEDWSAGAQGASTWVPSAEATQENSTKPTAPAVKTEQHTGVEAHVEAPSDVDVWFMERVCVQLKGEDKNAVIKEVNADHTATVVIEDDKTTRTVRASDVTRVLPKEKDMVLVFGGADVGIEGELVCIDGTDAILKDSNEDFKIVDFVHLAKIAGEA